MVLLDCLNAAVLHLRNNMGKYIDLGKMPGFKKISQEAERFGLGVCSSLICQRPVKNRSEFRKDANKHCKICMRKENAAVHLSPLLHIEHTWLKFR